jgi:hypothetical protein
LGVCGGESGGDEMRWALFFFKGEKKKEKRSESSVERLLFTLIV